MAGITSPKARVSTARWNLKEAAANIWPDGQEPHTRHMPVGEVAKHLDHAAPCFLLRGDFEACTACENLLFGID